MNYCTYSYPIKFNCNILALFAFGKFLLLKHVIYENIMQRDQLGDHLVKHER